jgi:DNA invertase Pin-like site-specific DNA recombinase
VLAILACIAKQELVRAAERVKAGLERARAVGTNSGRPIGAPPVVFDFARLVELCRAGESWRTIASVLKVSAGTGADGLFAGRIRTHSNRARGQRYAKRLPCE